jgi:hypothetical protein
LRPKSSKEAEGFPRGRGPQSVGVRLPRTLSRIIKPESKYKESKANRLCQLHDPESYQVHHTSLHQNLAVDTHFFRSMPDYQPNEENIQWDTQDKGRLRAQGCHQGNYCHFQSSLTVVTCLMDKTIFIAILMDKTIFIAILMDKTIFIAILQVYFKWLDTYMYI